MRWLALCSIAVAVCATFWLLGGLWSRHVVARRGGTPVSFWWTWVLVLAPACAPLVTWRRRRRFDQQRVQARLDPRWQVEYWLAACVLCAMLGVVIAGAAGMWFVSSARVVVVMGIVGGVLGYWWPVQRLRRRIQDRRRVMVRELPFMLDLLTLCVEGGLSLPLALRQVMVHAPAGPLRDGLADAAALERTGMIRSQWLSKWADVSDLAGVRSLVTTLAQADRLGMSLAPLLRAQAAGQRSARFLRAEKLALEAPVKMLFPMVLCIFPCTFLVIGFPVAVKLMDAGF